jgi:hypothetical protein
VYLREADYSKDSKSVYFKKNVGSTKFISLTYMMMDAMTPVTILSQYFQTENIDIAIVAVKIRQCIDDLENLREMNSPHLKKLQEDLQGGTFKEHHTINQSSFSIEKATQEFIDQLVLNINCQHFLSSI